MLPMPVIKSMSSALKASTLKLRLIFKLGIQLNSITQGSGTFNKAKIKREKSAKVTADNHNQADVFTS